MVKQATAMDGDFRADGPQEPRSNLRPGRIGLFLSDDGGRRAAMAAACADLIDTVLLADNPHQAMDMFAARAPDVLVVDLEGFTRDVDGDAMARLVAARNGAPTLLVCPGERASWLTALMAQGVCDYALAPITLETLYGQIAHLLNVSESADGNASLRSLLALRSRALGVLSGDDDGDMAARLCSVLSTWPGVVHAALFATDDHGTLRLAAQAGSAPIDLAPVLAADDVHAIARRSLFPALLAARSGELVIADARDDAVRLDHAGQLDGHTVGTVIGEPLPSNGPGMPLGALSLIFGEERLLSGDELLTISDIAQGAWMGLRMADSSRESDQLTAQLTRAATVDALTGVSNRRHGELLLEKEIKRARRYALPLAMISFDIDRFKDINDRYGHPCGDMALRTVAAAVLAVLRTTDMLVRAGGEEFQIIATHTSAIDGLKMAEKIRTTVASTPIPGCDRLTISLGVAQLADQESGDGLTVRVNAAMARAKRAGRNCVELAMT
ncbi:MAG: GGDEF domain-containing protein [Pseudomonadota bacterium]|nr:GGDEF domain-containing protein [Pseudomonadota bacterium]